MSLTVLIPPDDMLHVGNEISILIKTSLPNTTANLKIVCLLNVELDYDGGSFPTFAIQTLIPDADGKAKFFWNRFLSDAFSNEYDIPDVNGSSEFKTTKNIKRYTMGAIEYSGDPQSITHLLTSGEIANVRFAMQGGIPKHRFANMPFFGVSGWNLSNTPAGLGKAFLDWRGSNPRTRLTEDQWLYFIWQDPGGALGSIPIKMYGELYRSDGTVISGTFLTTPTMAKYDCYGLPAGFSQLGLSTFETANDKITRYEIFMGVDIGGIVELSERKVFHVDRKYYERVTQLQYLNTLGVMVQFTLRGKVVRKAKVDKDVSPRYYEQGYDVDQGQSLTIDQLVEMGGIVMTGSVDIHESKSFLELISSRKVLAGDRYQDNYPFSIRNAKYEFDTIQNVVNYELEIYTDFQDSVPDLFL